MNSISSARKVIIVDPDPKYGNLISQILKGEGFTPIVVHKGEKALQIAVDEGPHLTITEINLSDEINGYELARRIRTFSEMPILFVSAQDETQAILWAFEAGADDFISKPFDSRVLVARIKALLKRSSEKSVQATELNFQHITLHLAARQVTADNQPVYLTETEYNLLLELAKHHDRVLTHGYLLNAVWGNAYKDEVNYLRSYVHNLRRKLERDPANPQLILSRTGVGYVLVSSTQSEGGS